MALNDQTEMAFGQGDAEEIDPVSGNEVPPGSMPVEVRDDIDARLSEGEYVVPADVLRYYGLKFFEDLRAKAKVDLARMDQQGRIGGDPIEENIEGLPFDVSQLETADAPPEGSPELASGGVVGFDGGGDSSTSTNIKNWYEDWMKNNSVGMKSKGSNTISTVPFINAEGKIIYVQYRGPFDPLDPAKNALSAIPLGYRSKVSTPTDTAEISKPVVEETKEYGGELDANGMPSGSVGSVTNSALGLAHQLNIDSGAKQPSLLDNLFGKSPIAQVLTKADSFLVDKLGLDPKNITMNRAMTAMGNMKNTDPEYGILGDAIANYNEYGKLGKDKTLSPTGAHPTNKTTVSEEYLDKYMGDETSGSSSSSNQGNADSSDTVDFSQGPPGFGDTAADKDKSFGIDGFNMNKGGVAKKYTEPKKPKYTKGGFVSRRTKK